MKDRFNFYDVYGYLIPGFVLLGFVWLPFVLIFGEAPSLGVSDALGGLLLAYVLGHVLSSATASAFPSGRVLSPDDIRVPSDDMLDRKLKLNPPQYIDRLEEKIKEFGIDLGAAGATEKELAKLRRRAFLLCRDSLVLSGKGAYAEQFEGMYTMMRGITGASLLSAYYLLGWFIGGVSVSPSADQASGGTALTILAYAALVFVGLDFWVNRWSKKLAMWRSGDAGPQSANPAVTTVSKDGAAALPVRAVRWIGAHYPAIVFSFLVLSASYAGFVLGVRYPSLGRRPLTFVAVATATLFVTGRCYASYLYFAKIFAETVYRNFLALPKGSVPQAEPD